MREDTFYIAAVLLVMVCLTRSAMAADPDISPLPMIAEPPCIHLVKPVGNRLNPARFQGTWLKTHASPAAACDFTGNGHGDIAVFDGFTGHWYGLTKQGALLFWALPWGWPGCIPVPGDYDGDGIADLAVFEPQSGLWAVRALSGNVLLWEQPWGWPGCVPVPGDYDGDGKSDFAMFDPATAQWYIQTSAGAVLHWAFPWGWSASPDRPAAVPVPGDFDGNGRSDLIVMDADTGRYFACDVSGKTIAWDAAAP